jgi:hypothetical protein
MNFTPQNNVTNYKGIQINDFTGTSLSRGIELNLSAGTGKFNIYAQGTADNYLAGSLGIGSTSLTGYIIRVSKALTGSTSVIGMQIGSTINSDVTASANGYKTILNTQTASFTLGSLFHYSAAQGTIGAGSSITNQVGYRAESNLIGATNNYGFKGEIASGANRWNIFMDGTASNYLAGDTGIGSTTLGTSTKLTVGGTETASSAIARGQLINPTLVASANNDVLVGLDIAPTFTNGAFTGVTNTALRLAGNIRFQNANSSIRGDQAATQIVFGSSLELFATTGIVFKPQGSTTFGNMFTSGNLTLQNGGTFTDIPSARLVVNSTTQGFLPPRMTSTQKNAITSPAEGLIVFQTDGTIGLYLYASAAWHSLTML